MIIQFETLEARLPDDPKVRAEYDALGFEFDAVHPKQIEGLLPLSAA